jgi:hydroxyacid-oxoacid transhydrogenase
VEALLSSKACIVITLGCRYGPGVTAEVGQDMAAMGASKVGVFTDATLVNLPPVKTVLDSLTRHNVPFVLYDRVRVEPTDASFNEAASFAKAQGLDAFLAVGGGSVIDTAKAANLFSSDPEAELLDYVNAPIGEYQRLVFKFSKPIVQW